MKNPGIYSTRIDRIVNINIYSATFYDYPSREEGSLRQLFIFYPKFEYF